MANIIDFNEAKPMTNKDLTATDILRELLKESKNIKDIVIFIKDTNGDKTMFRTDASIEDKSLFIQLLQHDVFNDLAPSEDLDFEADM